MPAASHQEAERMVFLLQYVGTDYAGAVNDGKIVDESEYRENKEFASLIAETFDKIREALPPAKARALGDLVTELVELVSVRADPLAVRQVTESAIPILLAGFDLHPFPKDRPDPARARALYSENCAPCHGDRGGGDGPRAGELDPPPAKFGDRDRMESIAPYVFYNAITLGVANTAMASFRDAFTDQERWDLSFYLWTFTLPGEGAGQPPVALSLRDLAIHSSTDLASDVISQAAAHGHTIDASVAKEWVARLRANPVLLSDRQERLARLRQDLSRSVSLLEGGSLEEAAEIVTNSYLSDFEPLEPEIDLKDREIRQRFEHGLIDFRSALRRNDPQGALAIARNLQEATEAAARLLSDEPPKRGSVWILFGPAFAITAVITVLIGVRRRRSIGNRAPLG
jgi:high-affinity iron transporter